MMNHTLLLIDDEEKLRSLLAKILSMEGFVVLQAGDCKSGLQVLEQSNVDVVLSDVKLPDGRGVDLVKTIKEKHPTVEVILLTAYGNIPDGVQAMKNGAFDYLTKGDDNNKIIPLVYKALEKGSLSKRVLQLEKQLGEKHSFENIIGQSKVLQQSIELARKVAETDTTVLLTGETGTGKEVFAQAIHQASKRHQQHFVAINCAAFSKELLESEMFGHKAGAFTGATKDKKGLFEEAHQGTIFLDEIGEMPLDLQAKLLRVLETGQFLKVGESKQTTVNVRIIAATNRDLPKEIEAGHFREDLFYRISVFQIRLPALRERTVDIPLLAKHFIALFAYKMNKKVHSVEKEVLELLALHRWNGNIRELKNVIERSIIMMSDGELKAAHLPLDLQQLKNHSASSSASNPPNFDLAAAEKAHIQQVLKHTNGNKTKAAELLNIALTTLYRKIEDL